MPHRTVTRPHYVQESPSRLLQLLHGFWGAVAGAILGWILTLALPPLANWLKDALFVFLVGLCCTLAFRHGSAFWRALMESFGEVS